MRYNKYGATKTTVDSIRFDSKKESVVYSQLKLMERAGSIKDLKLQPEFELLPGFLSVDNKKVRSITYKADFSFYDNRHKRYRVIDTKGFITPVFALKRKIFDYKMRDQNIQLEFEIDP